MVLRQLPSRHIYTHRQMFVTLNSLLSYCRPNSNPVFQIQYPVSLPIKQILENDKTYSISVI